ncbi:MAG TPA: hypothetical protein VIR31_06135 [Nitrososphaeraceae archaeon]
MTATDDWIEVAAEQEQEETNDEQEDNYINNERSYQSFYRNIPME